MNRFLPPRVAYSRAERLSDAAVHIVGLVGAALAVPTLIIVAAEVRGDVSAIAGVSIYGACLTAMILFSALYNMMPDAPCSGILRRLDHSAIYFKIAGTYTPFTLLTGAGGYLLAAVWAAAVAGTGLRVLMPDRTRWICIGLYLGMGWAGAIAGQAVFEALSPRTFALIVLGGVLYTVGVVFYLAERLPFHTTIWHVFVLVASIVLYSAVTVELVVTARA